MKLVFNPFTGNLDYVASTPGDVGIVFPLAPNLGGTGVANAAGSTLTLGGATTVPAPGGTVALLATANVFTALQTISYNDLKLTNATAPTSAPSVALAGLGAGNVTNGFHRYRVTYYTAVGETEYSQAFNSVTVVDNTTNGQVALTNIPVSSDPNVIGRRIYRTLTGATFPNYLCLDIGNNTATTATDNIADGSLGVLMPSFNTTGGRILANAGSLLHANSLNTIVGLDAGLATTTGGNALFGYWAGKGLTSGRDNTIFGNGAFYQATTAANNTIMGANAGNGTLGSSNVIIGSSAGVNATSTSASNIIIGTSAGPTAAGAISNRLYIHNAVTDTPLIFGLFTGAGAGINIYSQNAAGTPLTLTGIASQTNRMLNIIATPNVGNAIFEAQRITVQNSTAATGGAAGFGPSLGFAAETATNGTDQLQGRVATKYTDPINTQFKSTLVLSAGDAGGLRDGIEVRANGSTPDIVLLGDTWWEGEGFGLPYGEIYGYNTATSLAVAGTGIANKVKVTAFTVDGESNLTTPSNANDNITIVKAGRYLVRVSLSALSGAGAGYLVGFGVFKNNGATQFQNLHAHRNLAGGGGDTGSLSMTGIIDVAANDTIEVWTWNETNTTAIVVDDITLSISMLGGT